jgi:hypothetical protein
VNRARRGIYPKQSRIWHSILLAPDLFQINDSSSIRVALDHNHPGHQAVQQPIGETVRLRGAKHQAPELEVGITMSNSVLSDSWHSDYDFSIPIDASPQVELSVFFWSVANDVCVAPSSSHYINPSTQLDTLSSS